MAGTSASETNQIYISVIVIVYDRDKYINDALRSLQNQTLNKEKFEVILVTNIRLTLQEFPGMNLRVIESSSKKGTAKYAEGMNSSKGEIICFLEDDDAFAPEKLEVVYNVFTSYPDIAFYKNNTLKTHDVNQYMNGSGRHKLDSNFAKIFKVSSSTSRKLFWKLRRNRMNFNTSSMCINKQFYYKDDVIKLLNCEGIAGDELIFLIPFTFRNQVNVVYDSRKITFYRRNVSFSKSVVKKVNLDEYINHSVIFIKFMIDSYEKFSNIFCNVPVLLEYGRLEAASYSLRLNLFTNGRSSVRQFYLALTTAMLETDVYTGVIIFLAMAQLILPSKLYKICFIIMFQILTKL